MICIITEDSKSGKQFWVEFKRLALGNSKNVKIQVARPSNHVSLGGTNQNEGGISLVKGELYRQIQELNKIPGKHLIFLAIDFVTNPRTFRYVQGIVKEVKRLQSNKSNSSIDFEICPFYCIEELFLSFKYLLEFSGLKKNNPSIGCQRAITIYNIIYKYLYHHLLTNKYWDYLIDLNNGIPINQNNILGSLDRNGLLYFAYNEYNKNHPYNFKESKLLSREEVGALCLEYITSINEKTFFRIRKSAIDICWFEDCFSRQFLYRNRFYTFYPKMNNATQFKQNACSDCDMCIDPSFGCQKGEDKFFKLLNNSFFKISGINIKNWYNYI